MQLVAFRNHTAGAESTVGHPRRETSMTERSAHHAAFMTAGSKSDAVRRYFGAYASKDRKVVDELLTDDFTFTSPYDDDIDKAAYFEKCWPSCERIRVHLLEKICEQGNDAFVLYKIITNDGKECRNSELFVFDGHRIRHVDVYFGAAYGDGTFVAQR
jgi:ketosteroid isomerase-like protein